MKIEDFLSLPDAEAAKLQTLDLRFSREIGLHKSWDFKPFCRKLSVCKNLRELNLIGQYLANLDETEWESLYNALRSCPNVRILLLNHNRIGQLSEVNFKWFCRIVGLFKDLEELSLGNNHLSYLKAEQWDLLGDVLERLLKLRKLSLYSNALFTPSAEHLRPIFRIFPRCQALEDVRLGNNGIYMWADVDLPEAKECFRVLYEGLTSCKKLTKVNFSMSNSLESDQLGELLVKMNPLTVECEDPTERPQRLLFLAPSYLRDKSPESLLEGIILAGKLAEATPSKKFTISSKKLFS